MGSGKTTHRLSKDEISELYQHYAQKLTEVPDTGLVPFHWAQLPSPIHFVWMPYWLMLQEFAAEIANSINSFAYRLNQLAAWSKVVDTLDDNGKFVAATEIIEPLATHTLLLPYVIKSRFAFAVSHLSHQANRAIDENWKDDFVLDDKIHLGTPKVYSKFWSNHENFHTAYEGLCNESFIKSSNNFRHVYSHRFSPKIVYGISNVVNRMSGPSDGRRGYTMGSIGPLQLPSILEVLAPQLNQSSSTFRCFQNLVFEQIEKISQYQVS